MLNIVLFGPPGAGKGTQSENLIQKYGLIHLSTGDLLRSEIARGTDLGKKAKEIMDRGELVGDDIVIGMIESKLDQNPHAKGFIFDGFPRTTGQAVALDDLLQKKGTGISGMLALEVNDVELVKRLLIRGQASGRPDDRNEEIIQRRIEEYNTKTLPLKNYYNEQGKFHSIHGIGSIEDIFMALVDRITFLNAEMDLTALESDLEHLDLTIQDFDVANDIEPELLLEIDAIKRSEAEEEEEARSARRAGKSKKQPSSSKQAQYTKNVKGSGKMAGGKVNAKAKPASKKAKATPTKAATKKSTKKAPAKKKSVRRVTLKKPVKKPISKKTVAKKATAKKTVVKKKAIVKKAVKKVNTKKKPVKSKSVSKAKSKKRR